MILRRNPFLREKQIVFPEGSFDLENGILGDLEKMFKPAVINPNQLPEDNHRTFYLSAGNLRVFFYPGEQVNKSSQVLSMDFEPDEKLLLSRFAGFYQRNLKKLPIFAGLPDGKNTIKYFLVVFSLNLQFVCTRDEELIVETISFLSTNHVLTCTCSTCGIIRNTILQPAVSRPPEAPITAN
jgi:hypothetical protein